MSPVCTYESFVSLKKGIQSKLLAPVCRKSHLTGGHDRAPKRGNLLL